MPAKLDLGRRAAPASSYLIMSLCSTRDVLSPFLSTSRRFNLSVQAEVASLAVAIGLFVGGPTSPEGLLCSGQLCACWTAPSWLCTTGHQLQHVTPNVN